MNINYEDLKEIFIEVIDSLDDGIIVLNDTKDTFAINETAVHLLKNNTFKLSEGKLQISKNNSQSKDAESNINALTKYFELYPPAEDIILSVIAKDKTNKSVQLCRKVLRMEESGRLYFVIIIKA
jgi:hypothetical protein